MGQGKKSGLSPEQLEQIAKLSKEIRYGTINLVFQVGVLVQIEKNEKIRVV